MASVFLSYDRDDVARARTVASALGKAGHQVWWDRHITGGQQYSEQIQQALDSADAIVVLWSAQSIDSAWVRDEAAVGRDTRRLVPVRIDQSTPPLGFRQYQTIDLADGRLSNAKLTPILEAITRAIAADAPSSAPTTPSSRQWPWRALTVLLIFGTVLAGLLLWRPWSQRDEVVLAVGPSNAAPASRALADDLAVALGALQTTAAMAVRLVEVGDSSARPLLVLETSASDAAHATLALKLARDSSILWSKDFNQPSGRRADLLQQLAYTAGRVTGCANQGVSGTIRLSPAPLKNYLIACASLSDLGTVDVQPPIPLLLKVIEDSPTFTPAWGKLLLAESAIISPESNQGQVDLRAVAELRRHVAAAQKVDPNIVEIRIAQAALLPEEDFAGRRALAEQAMQLRPNLPEVLLNLAASYAEVGQLAKAVDASSQAVDLDPLSPAVRSSYIALIAYSGALDSARHELQEAERLWPGTESLWDARFRFHYRYGDARLARILADEKIQFSGRAPRLYLTARENPTPQNVESLIDFVGDRLRSMENPTAGIGFALLAYAQFGRSEDVFKTLLDWPRKSDLATISEILFRPEFRGIRHDPRFLTIAQRAGLLSFWLESGQWPDFCFEADQPYDCKVEAAKLR